MYKEKSKNRARQLSLTKAIRLLTKERDDLTIASKSYLREVWEQVEKYGTAYDRMYNSELYNSTIKRWEKFYSSITGSKKPENLKVAYLCGPEPLNDLKVLVKCGVLPENVWAFESDKITYNVAVTNMLSSAYPFLKISKTDIKTFVSTSPIKFDLIYLDFCGPIYSRGTQKPLETITAIAKYQSLNSPGIILTNFALVNEDQDPDGFKIATKLTSAYLYPKGFLENYEYDSGVTEGPIVHGFEYDDFEVEVRENLPKYYGQFVSRTIMDVFDYLVQADRFMNNEKYLNIFFKTKNEKQKPKSALVKFLKSFYEFTNGGGGGDVICDPSYYPLLWSFAKFTNTWKDSDPILTEHGKKFIKQLTSYSNNEQDFFEKLTAFQFLATDGIEKKYFYTDSLLQIADNWRVRDKYQFCDLFLFHQLKDLLIRQISVPYQVNVAKCERWTYQAKDTQMFLDMTVLDECRYLYDWMPTMDMLEANLDNVQIELSFRYIMDALGKHTRYFQEEVFNGTAVVPMGYNRFEPKVYTERVEIEQ